MSKSIVRELVTLWGFEIDGQPLKELDAGINTIKSSLKALGIATAATAGAIGYLLNEAGEDEQTLVAFEVMLGSAELAQKKLEELKQFAANTPFELRGLKDLSTRLLAFNFSAEELIPTLSALGDISAGVGTDKMPRLILALGQVKAAGKLTGQELRQFAEAGVPLLGKLAEALGKSEGEVQSMIRAGKIGFPQVRDALFAMTQDGGKFFNLMAKQSKTLFGMWSNFKDWINILAIELGNKLLPATKEVFKEFLNWLDANRAIIKENLVEFVENLVGFLVNLIGVMKTVYRFTTTIAQAFGGWNKVLGTTFKLISSIIGIGLVLGIGLMTKALGGLLIAWGANLFAMAATIVEAYVLAGASGSLSVALTMMGNSALVANAKLMAIPLAIGAIVVAIALIAEDIMAFSQGRDSVFGRMVNGLDEIFGSIKEKFGVFGHIGQFLLTAIMTPIRAIVNGFKTLFTMFDIVRGKIGIMDGLKQIGGNLLSTAGFGSAQDGMSGAMGLGNFVKDGNSLAESRNSAPIAGLGGAPLNNKNGDTSEAKQEFKLELNVTGMDPDVAKDLVTERASDMFNGMLRETMRDGQNPVDR